MGAGRPIVMPKLGLTMTEGLVSEWKVAPGDSVQPGDLLFVVETDKIANEIEASEAGTIERLLVAEGEVVPVGAVVATLAGGERAAAAAPAPERAAPATVAPAPAPSPAHVAPVADRRMATPLARRLAARAQLDLTSISGSGPRGRIMADDVAAAVNAADKSPVTLQPQATVGQPLGTMRPLGSYQKVAARRLTEAKRDIPHFYVMAEVDVTDLVAARASLNGDAGLPKLTVNHFLIAAVARALVAVPAVNCVWADDAMLDLPQADVGMAVEGKKGLVAPVLRDLGGRTLDEIATAATQLVDRARAGRLAQDELQGGAITISNVGMFGATGLIPIVNPGQSSILGVGRNRPAYQPDEHGQPRLRQMLKLSLSCDHRVIDGALAARFLQKIQTGLEAPLSLLRRPTGEVQP